MSQPGDSLTQPVPDPDTAALTIKLDSPDPTEAAPDSPPSSQTLQHEQPPGATPPAAQVPIGLAGRYRVGELIGRGGMGEVLSGHDPELDRDLALKVLLPRSSRNPREVERFRDEARIAGQLQHPGVVPVYDLGQLPDGRPYFAMKLVQGQTLAALFDARGTPAQDRPRFLKVFEQLCQTVAFAHSRHVLHRDLKPGNVMVGAFGEVQVMDWGVAKVLGTADESVPQNREPLPVEARTSVVQSQRAHSHPDTREGDVLGTPHYMPPEQALGEIDRLDERCDVFSLGAILCEILTGEPPYFGETADVLRKATRGDLREALDRLDGCAADVELIGLAKRCLRPERDDRPRNAAEVARGMEGYLAGVEDRARQAELERAGAEAREQEARQTATAEKAKAVAERQARRLTLWLAVSTLLLVVAGGTGVWRMQQQRAAANQQARLALNGATVLLEQGWQANDLGKLAAAEIEADKAGRIAGASPRLLAEAEALAQEAKEKREQAGRNATLLAALLDVSTPRETKQYERSASGQMTALAEPTVEEQFAAAFRRWEPSLDLDRTPIEVIVAKLEAQPSLVIEEIVGGLETWLLERRQQRRPATEWQRLLELADRLDSSERRRDVRRILVSDRLLRERIVGELSEVLLPWSALSGPITGEIGRRLEAWMPEADLGREPVLGIVSLARALQQAGHAAGAERVLRTALAARPDQVVLLEALARLLTEEKRWGQALECFRAARALRPHLGLALGMMLCRLDRAAEAETVLRDLLKRQPNNPEIHIHLGYVLHEQKNLLAAADAYRTALVLEPRAVLAQNNLGTVLADQKKLPDATAAFRQAIALKPEYHPAHNNLGLALAWDRKLEEAVSAFQRAIKLNPRYAEARNNLGVTLHRQKKLDEAIASFRDAIAVQPEDALVHYNLGLALGDRKEREQAIAAFRRAIVLQPAYAKAHYNLGISLADQKKLDQATMAFRKAIEIEPAYTLAHNGLGLSLYHRKQLDEAVAVYRRAIALQPDYAEAHCNLGLAHAAQNRLDEAIAAYRQAIALKSDHAEAYNNLGVALRKQKKLGAALDAFRQADQLRPNQSLIRNNLRRTERWLEMERILPAILEGKVRPRDAREALELADFCLTSRRWCRPAQTFYRDAFQLDPKLAENLNQPHRYNAACAAILAAAGKGDDPGQLESKERDALRKQALEWLRADLSAYGELMGEPTADLKQAVRRRLSHWIEDEDLATVRDEKALAGLSEAERGAWKKLWSAVTNLLEKTVTDR